MSSGAGLFLSAFIDELTRLGVTDVVVSPGSRSTPLAMVFEQSAFRLYVDIDERGAGFFALGLAKAKRTPVCLLCTSGTAVANYYPAVCEARAARVPLIVLTADRPHDLRGFGAVQTTDQLKIFGDMPVFFHEMPIPGDSPAEIAFARQVARESVIRATGTPRGVAHLNFPLKEPLIPDLTSPLAFSVGRREETPLITAPGCALASEQASAINGLIEGKRGVILCGEADYPASIVELARRLGFPILADPLSNLRQLGDDAIIENYDNIFRREDRPEIDVVIRFGQYPVSKATFTKLGALGPLTIVVDETETRDFNHGTDVFVRAQAADFIEASAGLANTIGSAYLAEWVRMNDEERSKILAARESDPPVDGAYVISLLDEIREGSLLFAANSMAIRYVDTFYTKRDKALTVLCNRGLNGIDGTTSSALGASQCFESATLLTGDLAFLHDINALHLQRELDRDVTVVVFNNNGGGIFEMLPQQSDDPYFERLFLTPHDVDFAQVVAGFRVPFTSVESVEEFVSAYRAAQGSPGIKVIEVRTGLSGLKEQYLKYC